MVVTTSTCASERLPVLQARTAQPMQESLLKRPKEVVQAYALPEGGYDIEQDPLHNGQYVPGMDEDGRPIAPLQHLYFYQCDHLGTPQELTDESGAIAWEASYKAWGEAKVTISEAARKAGLKNPIRFQGQFLDEESGLHYNRFRYYDPHSGRFVSKDPIRLAGGTNLQRYAPNPIQWTDPKGLAPCCPSLLPGEGDVGKYKDLKNAGSKGDNLTPHHIPSDAYMEGKGVPGYTRNDGVSINMEMPASGGRHRQTSSYGVSPDLSINPRDMLAQDIRDARKIYQRNNCYTPEIRSGLQQVIAQNKTQYPSTFKK